MTVSTSRADAAMTSIPSTLRRAPRTAGTMTSSCSAFHQSTTESARPTLRGKTATLQTFGGSCQRSTPTTSAAPTPTRQEVSRYATFSYRQRDVTSPTRFPLLQQVESLNDWGDRGCRTFVPVLKGDGTKNSLSRGHI